MNVVLPKSTVDLIEKHNNHPGLRLDKFSEPGDQKAQKSAIDEVCKISGNSEIFASVCERQKNLIHELPGTKQLTCTTLGPLTLHLARASALENAGICLHPIYGFAYLPGSGLKGMAHAYAETVWLQTQTDRKNAWRRIEDVFGWASNPDRKKQINDPDHPAEIRREDDGNPQSPDIKACTGSIVFHDAWPEAWPKLTVDIVNNHHPHYYSPPDDENTYPPGDWENPNPVYFLAVKPGTTFTFALSKRRKNISDEMLDLASQWLLGALCHTGAGAKTNAGYGAFQPADDVDKTILDAMNETWRLATTTPTTPPEKEPTRAEFSAMLELVTPAFLAGAEQYGEEARESCDLRPATLRGLLRWWWRTMHAGYLDVKTLRALEAAIWGDTEKGGAVRVIIERVKEGMPSLYDKQSKINFTKEQKQSGHGIPNEDAKKITQGLWYLSYGMGEKNRERYYIEPGSRWVVKLVSRPIKGDYKISQEKVLKQAETALWLLCNYGGVGSKARKGFGSIVISDFQKYTLKTCSSIASDLRVNLGLQDTFQENNAHSPSVVQMISIDPIEFSWPNVWNVLDQVGFAYQSFAKKFKHKLEKKALGLPRRIGQPKQGSFNPKPPVTSDSRHSSPVHIHLDRTNDGWKVRAIAFPATHLPDTSTSQNFLQEFLKAFKSDLQRRAELQPLQGSSPAHQQQILEPKVRNLPNPGDYVEAELLEKKTKKGGWKAKHIATGIAGPIQNSPDVPSDKKASETIKLKVSSANENEIAFRYPTDADKQREQKSKSQGGSKSKKLGGKGKQHRKGR